MDEIVLTDSERAALYELWAAGGVMGFEKATWEQMVELRDMAALVTSDAYKYTLTDTGHILANSLFALEKPYDESDVRRVLGDLLRDGDYITCDYSGLKCVFAGAVRIRRVSFGALVGYSFEATLDDRKVMVGADGIRANIADLSRATAIIERLERAIQEGA